MVRSCLPSPAMVGLGGVATVVSGAANAPVCTRADPRDYMIAEPTWVIGPLAVIRTKDYKFAMRVRPQNGNAVILATADKDVDWAIKARLEDIEPTLFELPVDAGKIHDVA